MEIRAATVSFSKNLAKSTNSREMELALRSFHWNRTYTEIFFPPLRKLIPEVTLKSVYPLPEGKCGRFCRFNIRNNDIANWDKPWLSELEITSSISEIKLLISDFSIVDFRFSGIAICDFGFLNSGFRFLISDFWFQVSECSLLNCYLRYRVNHGLKIKYFKSKITRT